MPITSAMYCRSSVVTSLSSPTMLLSVPNTALPAVSSTMSLASSPSVSEGYAYLIICCIGNSISHSAWLSVALLPALSLQQIVQWQCVFQVQLVTTAVPFSTSSGNASTNACS